MTPVIVRNKHPFQAVLVILDNVKDVDSYLSGIDNNRLSGGRFRTQYIAVAKTRKAIMKKNAHGGFSG
jgi:hypothetical protein